MVSRPAEQLDLPIQMMRELGEKMSLKPARGRGKVAIVDDADYLTPGAANSFLKTLEEPPPHSLLILVGSTPELQLATIISRCQVVRFRPLPDALVAELLREQGVEDPAQAQRLARVSGGSPGLASALAEPALWEFRNTLVQALTAAQPDSVALGQAWMEFVAGAGKESLLQRRRAGLALRLLVDFLDDALVLSLDGRPRTAEPDDLRSLEALARRQGSERLMELIERCLQADHQVERYVQLVLVLEALADALAEKLKTPAA
jgi:DNA polymerase-3 subunit delta'